MKKMKARVRTRTKTKLGVKIATVVGTLGLALAAAAGMTGWLGPFGEPKLEVSVDSSTPSSRLLLTGSSDNPVAVFRFTATGPGYSCCSEDGMDELPPIEPIELIVKKLTIQEEGAPILRLNGDQSPRSVDTLTIEYTDSTGVQRVTAAPNADSKFVFENLSIPVSTRGDEVRVKVFADIALSDEDGGTAVSNDRLQFALSDDEGDFLAIDSNTGEAPLIDLASFLSSRRFVVRRTVPTLSVNSLTPSDLSAVPGVQEVLRFNIDATATEDVALDQIVFNMLSTDNAGSNWNTCAKMTTSNFTLYEQRQLTSPIESSDADWELLNIQGQPCSVGTGDVGYAKLSLANPIVVPAGSSRTYHLYVNTYGASTAQDDAVLFSIPKDLSGSSMQKLSGVLRKQNIAPIIDDIKPNPLVASRLKVGDVIALDNSSVNAERMLVTKVVEGDSIEVVRGYAGTTPQRYNLRSNTNLYRVPTTVSWHDYSRRNEDARWGADLLPGLEVRGGNLIY